MNEFPQVVIFPVRPGNYFARQITRWSEQYRASETTRIDAMEEIANGYGRTIGQVALAWLLTNPLITAPIVGARNAEQLGESIDAAGFRLTQEEMLRLNEMTEWREGGTDP